MAGHWFHRVAKLRAWRQRAFLLALATRAWPHLQLYAGMQDMEKPARQLEGLLDAQWSLLAAPPSSSVWAQDPEGAASAVRKLFDQWHDWLDSDESFGADAARGFVDLLEGAWRVGQPGEKVEARVLAEADYQLVLSAVELQEGEGLCDEDLIALFDQHPWCRQAAQWQRQVLRCLEERDKPDAEMLAQLRVEAENDGVSNLGLGLNEPESE